MKRLAIMLMVAAVLSGNAATVFAKGFFKVGEQAPTFTLTSITGESVSLKNLRGKVVVLGLFHICKPCLVQGTNLQQVYEATLGKNVAVIGVNSSGDSKIDVVEFLQSFPVKVTYPYLIDPSQVTDQLYGGGRFIPNVYVVDQSGVIRWQRVGNMDLAGQKIILEVIEQLLNGQSLGIVPL